MLPPRGTSKVEDFDLQDHIEFEEEVNAEADDASASGSQPEDEEIIPKFR